jgi:hypothetical protein
MRFGLQFGLPATVTLAALLGVTLVGMGGSDAAQDVENGPQFRYDPTWPKPLPNE